MVIHKHPVNKKQQYILVYIDHTCVIKATIKNLHVQEFWTYIMFSHTNSDLSDIINTLDDIVPLDLFSNTKGITENGQVFF